MSRYDARDFGSTAGDDVPLSAFGPDGTASNPVSMDRDRTGSVGSEAAWNRVSSPIHEANEEEEEETNYLYGPKLLLVMASISMIILLAYLDTAILGTAIPKITSDFQRLNDVGWYVAAYLLTSATIQPLTAKIYTYFSNKWTYLTFFGLFEAGSAICGASSSSAMLIAGRAVAGAGASGIFNGSLIISQGACDPKTRPMYIGLSMGIGQIGVIAGPLLGGLFTEHASWRWCFYLNLPLGAVAAAFMVFVDIPDHIHKEPMDFSRVLSLIPHFDLPGFALFAPSCLMLLLALQFGASEYSWDSPVAIGLFCGAGASFALFVLWEHRVGDEAMIPFSMIRQKVIWASALNFAMLLLSANVGVSFMPIYLQGVRGLTPSMSGVYLLGQVLPSIVFILSSGALVQRWGYYIYWSLAAAGLCTIGCGLVTTWQPDSNLGEIIGYQVILAARGMGIQMGVLAIQYNLPPKTAALGSSFLVFTQNIFGAVFATVGNTVFQEVLRARLRSNAPEIDPERAIAAGGSAEGVRALAPPGKTRDALFQSYTDAVAGVYYMLVVMTFLAFLVAFGMGWTDIRQKSDPKKEKKNEYTKRRTT